MEVGGGGERLGEQAVGFVLGAGVVRPEGRGQGGLGVPGGHADGVVQAFAFVVEADGVGADVAEGDFGGGGGGGCLEGGQGCGGLVDGAGRGGVSSQGLGDRGVLGRGQRGPGGGQSLLHA